METKQKYISVPKVGTGRGWTVRGPGFDGQMSKEIPETGFTQWDASWLAQMMDLAFDEGAKSEGRC